MSSCGDTSEWSFEAIEAVVCESGALRDVQIPPRHSMLVGRPRLRSGEVVTDGVTKGDLRRRPDHRGRVTVIRSPLPDVEGPAELAVETEIPDVPKEPTGIPWSTLIPSVLGGAVIAFLFSPLFAVLAGVSALGVIGRSLGSRYAHRRKTKQREAAIVAVIECLPGVVAAWSLAEAGRRHRTSERAVRLVAEGLEAGEAPWSRRLRPEELVVARLGRGSVGVVPILEARSSERLAVVPDVLAMFDVSVELRAVPVEVGLGAGRGLALCGDREPALGVARSILLHLLADYGPADLGFVLVVSPDRLVDWDWAKWLPSLVGVGTTVAEVEDVFDRVRAESNGSAGGGTSGVGSAGVGASIMGGGPLGSTPAPRPLLVVVDGIEPSGPGALAQVFAGRSSEVRFVWIGSAAEIPAACATRAIVRPDGSLEVEDLTAVTAVGVERFIQRGQADLLGLKTATSLARILGSFDDPELQDVGASLPARVSHEALYPGELDVAGWGSVLVDRWGRADRRRLTTTLGLDRSGPLVLDLVADGPHVLAAGTTGSGKSEMLRSLIVGAAIDQPPDHVSFVLVDFKGGGAFDLVADLPHVAAVVTDLDPAESSRALQSLQAEMKAREERLREYGCSDISELGQVLGSTGPGPEGDAGLGPTMPRLVIVVDEFASLADELPEFLDGLIDVARRGRSLGVHLVLATQRPAGVVTGQIRANTNLRICLRVQDQADSQDVIEVPDAARLPAIPGRAIVSRGGAKSALIQCVKVEADDTNRLLPFVLHPSIDVGAGAIGDAASSDETEAVPSIAALVEACLILSPIANVAPWLDPITDVDLREVSDALEANRSGEAVGGIVPIGWLDDPDNRARLPFGWEHDRSPLAIIGSDSEEVEASVRIAVAGLIAAGAAHVYVLDGSAGRLASLERLASVGSVVPISEPERCAKALEVVRRALGSAGEPGQPRIVGLVIHRWGAVIDSLEAAGGPGAGANLQRLLRDGVDRGLGAVLTASSDREIPGRVLAGVGQRILHRLADPSGYLGFGLRAGAAGISLAGARMIDPGTGLYGLVGRVEIDDLVSQERGLVAPPVRVLGDRVKRCELSPVVVPGRLCAPLGLDQELAQVTLTLGKAKPVLVLGRPGSGRTTAITTILDMLPGSQAEGVVVIDESERLDAEDVRVRIDEAKSEGKALLIGATPAMGRGIGSWLAPLLADATIVLINPSRADGEVCRTIVPDLVDAVPGRAVVLDSGRSTIVQIAA